MNQVRYTPNRWFDFPIDRFFDDIWNRTITATPTVEGFLPRADIRDEKDAVVVTAELPGVAKDDISVELQNGVLSLSAEKKSERKEDGNGFYRSERVYGNFKRSFRVPEAVDSEKISAEYANGVLTLTLPKRPEAAPKQIAIAENGDVRKIATK